MGETEAHKLLKQRAKQELKRRGFGIKEIIEEYKLSINKYHWYLIDVVGISEEKKIAYECGTTTIETLKEELIYFDKVVWLPYLPLYGRNWLHKIYGDVCLKHRISPLKEVRRFLEGDTRK